MKRSGPPARRTPMRRGRGLARGRAPKPMSAKRAAERPQRDAVREHTFARAGWACEARTLVPEVECGGPLDCDERTGRGRDPGSHLDASLTQALCRLHHVWVTNHPAEARQRGLRWHSWERDDARRA